MTRRVFSAWGDTVEQAVARVRAEAGAENGDYIEVQFSDFLLLESIEKDGPAYFLEYDWSETRQEWKATLRLTSRIGQ